MLFGAGSANWLSLILGLILSALGVLVSVSIKEMFEAQTLANAFRFPMMFLGGVFVPVASLPLGLQIVVSGRALTYAVEVLYVAISGGKVSLAMLDLAVLAASRWCSLDSRPGSSCAGCHRAFAVFRVAASFEDSFPDGLVVCSITR